MSLLFGSSRHRKLFIAAATIAAVGYASYRAYHSSAFTLRRRRLLQILSTISFCCEAISESAESLSVLSRDLKSFLLSDDDSVPRSFRQAFKIGQCVEFQETATVLSAALTRGLLGTSSAKPRKEVQGCGRGCSQHVTALPFRDHDVASQDMACKEIREASFSTRKEERSKEFAFTKSIPFSNEESGVSDFQEWEIKSYSSGGDPYSWRTRRAGNVMDRSRRGHKDSKHSEDLPVRLLTKLFSEPGVGFASAVAGTLSRNFVSAFFEAAYTEKSPHGDFRSSSEKNWLDEKRSGPAKILEVLSTSPCRMLIADSIQTSISTAVTVYIDKTKDVNFYDDIVAGITNPSHKDSIKELMTSVCNGAVETLVKTVRGAMFAENNISDNHLVIQDMSAHGEILQGHDIAESSQAESMVTDVPKIMGGNSDGVQSFIEGVSKTLAVPSNRKLVVDMAGTMTSEAVRSFVDVVTNTVTNYFCSKRRGCSEEIKRKVSLSLEHLQVQERSKDMAAKAVVLASICLAICLHLLTCIQLLQKA